MWMMTPRGFFSTVQHREHPSLVLVRARSREDLENLCELGENRVGMIGLDASTIIETRMADYPYRLIVSARCWQRLVELMAEEITYSNFKSAVHAVNRDRASTYLDVWSALHRIEEENPKRLSLWERFRGKFDSEEDEEFYIKQQVELLLDDIADEEDRNRIEKGDFYDSLTKAIEQIELYDQAGDVEIYDPNPEIDEGDERP